jgi:hypothetical protein
MIKVLPVVIFALSFTTRISCMAQVVIPPGIRILSKDSLTANKLVSGLTVFINGIDTGKTNYPRVAVKDKVQTLDLIDELRSIQQSQKYKNRHFYKPQLINAVQLNDTAYFIQLSFIGISDSTAMLRGCFDLIGYTSKTTDFTFSSPISWNTRYWKVKKLGDINFHYKDKLNTSKATEFSTYVAAYDSKLGNNKNNLIEYYCCNDATEALRMLGVLYKSDYTGRKNIGLSTSGDMGAVIVSSNGGEHFDEFDPHDLWHDRRNRIIPANLINRPVDEGCAYLYGGSWGLTWKEIYRDFQKKLAVNRQTDWLDLYEKEYNFADSTQQELLAGYVINALLVRKLEKDKGFSSVAEFLKCGPLEKGNENYFAALNKLLGINKQNFNTEVWKLIDMAARDY